MKSCCFHKVASNMVISGKKEKQVRRIKHARDVLR